MASLFRIETVSYGPQGVVGRESREATEDEANAIGAKQQPPPRAVDSSSMAPEQNVGAEPVKSTEGSSEASFHGEGEHTGASDALTSDTKTDDA